MTLYRLTMTGAEGPLTVPLASLQVTRREGQSSWLTVDAPTWSAVLEATLRAETDWVIEIDVDEVAFLRATLTEITPDRRPWAVRLILTGRIINPAFVATTRPLVGVSERGDDDGRHIARCAVDNDLRPNDTVDDGVDSWIAGSIDYTITPWASWMTVQEAL